MGIRFNCPACSKKVHVKEHLAGLRGFCPKCGSKFEIPLQSTRVSSKQRRAQQAGGEPTAGVAPSSARSVDAEPRSGGERPLETEREATLGVALPRTGRLISVSNVAPIDPIEAEPTLQWYVVPPNGTEPFGPASGATMRQWIREGRVAVHSLVWREDWPEWRKAGTVWTELVLSRLPSAADVAHSP